MCESMKVSLLHYTFCTAKSLGNPELSESSAPLNFHFHYLLHRGILVQRIALSIPTSLSLLSFPQKSTHLPIQPWESHPYMSHYYLLTNLAMQE
jgi:hypothetical protein